MIEKRRFPAGSGSSSKTEALKIGRKPSEDNIYPSDGKIKKNLRLTFWTSGIMLTPDLENRRGGLSTLSEEPVPTTSRSIFCKKEDLAQVNPQLHTSLRIINARSSNDTIAPPYPAVNTGSDAKRRSRFRNGGPYGRCRTNRPYRICFRCHYSTTLNLCQLIIG